MSWHGFGFLICFCLWGRSGGDHSVNYEYGPIVTLTIFDDPAISTKPGTQFGGLLGHSPRICSSSYCDPPIFGISTFGPGILETRTSRSSFKAVWTSLQ